MKGLISCSVVCRFYDIPTGKCRLKCEEKADPDAKFYDDCPLPDVVEVKHGKWEEKEDYWFETIYICSECKEEYVLVEGTPEQNNYSYCPNCGAKMDGGENDGN